MWVDINERKPESVYVLLYLPELEKDISFPGHAFLISNHVIWDWQRSDAWWSGATHWMHITTEGWRDIIEDPPHENSSSILIIKGHDTITVSNPKYPVIPKHIETDKITKWKPIPAPPGYAELCKIKCDRLDSPPTFFYELSEYDRG